MYTFAVRTGSHTQFVNIDRDVQRAVDESGIESGVAHVFVPHTTAGVTINENADPNVVRDLEAILERMAPWNNGYTHDEGNSAAHAKASLMGFCQTVLIENGRLALGTWQSLYFAEFDGPRNRSVWVQVIGA
ncbi:MAG: hypothetical protein QG656_2019 [Candidatus Hydrogenedentes bacterium]|nr:hypothetical protein [Candidatus Hydrogenedentota bacterium]